MVCPLPAQQIVFQEYVRAVTEQHERLERLKQELQAAVQGWRLFPVVEAIQALRGVELTGAVILMAELGDITRFANPRQLMSYLGLTPSEYSSGERRRQGGITKAGNGHARRALVERWRPSLGRLPGSCRSPPDRPGLFWRTRSIDSHLEPSAATRPRCRRNLRSRYEAPTLVPRAKQAP